MIPFPLLFALAFVKMFIALGILSETLIRKLLMLGLGRLKDGKSQLVERTVAATFAVVFGVALMSVLDFQRRKNENGVGINPTDEILRVNGLLETSLMGFCLFLYVLIDRLYYYMKKLEDQKSSSQGKLKDI